MEERKLNEHICADCGNKFYTYGNTRRILCDKCKSAKRKKNTNAEIYKVYIRKKKSKQKQKV